MAIETLFGTAAGAPVALVNPDAWYDGQPIRIADACDLMCRGDIAVLAAEYIEVRAQMRSIGGGAGDWVTIAKPLDRGVADEWVVKPERIAGAIATDVPFGLFVPGGHGTVANRPGSDVRLQARRHGGGATTTFFVDGERRYCRGSVSLLAQLRAAGGGGATMVGTPFVSRAPLIATGAYVYGNEFEAGDANYLSLIVAKTLGNNPTNVDFDIQSSVDAGATWASLPQVDGVAGGITTEQGMTLQTTEIGAAVGTFDYAVPIFPGRRYRVGVLFTGGTAPTLGINCQLFRI